MYLVDTNVLSARAPNRAQAAGLVSWMERSSSLLYISVITIAEVESGIAKAKRSSASVKAARLEAWLDTILHIYSPRILLLDLDAAKMLGRLADQALAAGHSPGWADLAIAATAKVREFTVLTRNTRHFRAIGVATHDPFEKLPV